MKSYKLKANGADLHVVEAGDGGTAVVFLHYWGGNTRTYETVINLLSRDFRSVAFDQRGWGSSTKEGEYSIAASAADTVAVIQELGLKSYILVGHSRSGKVAQLVASENPAGLKGLVLLAPAPASPLPVPEADRNMYLHLYQSREGVENALPILAKKPLSAEQKEQIVNDTVAGAYGAKEDWTKDGMIADITSAAARITVPTIVIVGTEDAVVPEALLRTEIPKTISHASFQVLEGLGHLPPLEAPEELAEAIRAFASGLAA